MSQLIAELTIDFQKFKYLPVAIEKIVIEGIASPKLLTRNSH